MAVTFPGKLKKLFKWRDKTVCIEISLAGFLAKANSSERQGFDSRRWHFGKSASSRFVRLFRSDEFQFGLKFQVEGCDVADEKNLEAEMKTEVSFFIIVAFLGELILG